VTKEKGGSPNYMRAGRIGIALDGIVERLRTDLLAVAGRQIERK